MKEVFLQRMQQYLGNEYEAYVESLSKPLYRGLRLIQQKQLYRKSWKKSYAP